MKQQVIKVTGGLDLITDKLTVPQGSAQACLNYEVGIADGIRSIDGFSRWDGRRNSASATRAISIALLPDASATSWTVGAQVNVSYLDSVDNSTRQTTALVYSVADSVNTGGDPGEDYNHLIKVVLIAAPVNFNLLGEVTDVDGYAHAGVSVSSFVPADATAVDTYYRATVTDLPGDSLTRIPGLHFFNDKLFAVVDLVAIQLTAAGPTPLEGATVYAANDSITAIGTVALVRGVSGTPGDAVWELFDYTEAYDLDPSTQLYFSRAQTNLVVNGGFYTGATYWTTTAGWAITGTGPGVKAVATATNTALTHTLAAVAGTSYDVTYTVTRLAGSVTMSFGGGPTVPVARSASGTYTESIVATSAAVLTFTGTGFTGDIDDVQVYQTSPTLLSNGDFTSGSTGWTLGSGWTVPASAAVATAADATALTHTFAPVSGKVYRVKYTITRSTGTVQVSMGGVQGTTRSASGTYVDFLVAASAAVFKFTGGAGANAFTGTVDDISIVLVEFAGEVVDHVEPTRATIYSADWDGNGGWTRRDLGRVMAYAEDGASDLGAFFLNYQRNAFISELDAAEVQDTGWIGADGWEDIGGGNGPTWPPGGAQTDLAADDGAVVGGNPASAVPYDFSTTLKATFSADVLNIPAGALVRGIQVRVYRQRGITGASLTSDHLVTIGTTSTPTRANRSSGTEVPFLAYPAAGRDVTYGGANDLWPTSNASIRPTDINDGAFNVQLQYKVQNTDNVSVDHVAVKVYYQDQTRKAYVYNPAASPTDQEIEVIHRTISQGTSTGGTGLVGDRRGLLVLNPQLTDVVDARPWAFGPGLAIRTEPAGGGVILAYTASTDTPITLASSYRIAEEDARYQFHSANPYASDLYDVTFVVNGAEYGSMFDGTYLLPIQTGLLEQYEQPRHVVWAGNYLALGYRTGTLSLSDQGDPLTYIDAASIAADIGASDRVTGLCKLKGTALGVCTENSVFALQGSDPSALVRVEISTESGCIEYSLLTVGQPILLNYGGPATISTTDQYGDFNQGGLAGNAAPWFLDRLQLPSRDETVDRTFVAAYPMRSKNQARYLFADGWQATLTFVTRDGRPAVEVTTQRLYGNWQSRDASAIRVLGLCYGTSSTGQDLAFMSFAVDTVSSRYRYVFQIDMGRSFDGEEIITQWTSQPLQLGPPFYRKFLDQFGLYGKAFGYAHLKVFKATELETPVSDEQIAASTTGTFFDLGISTNDLSIEKNYRAIGTLRAEGEDVTVLIESISASARPHTIQSLVLRSEPEDPKA